MRVRRAVCFEAWPDACVALAMLPNLRSLKIYLANPQYLDKQYLMGQRSDTSQAILEFVKEMGGKPKQLEMYVGGTDSKEHEGHRHWRLRAINAKIAWRLEKEFRIQGIVCKWLRI